MLFATGDFHRFSVVPGGRTSTMSRLSEDNLLRCGINPSEIPEGSVLLAAGDLGWCFCGGESDSNVLDFVQERCAQLGVVILAVDGNHDWHEGYASFPECEFCSGRARRLRPNVYFAIRGEGYVIEGKMVATLGGARSIDRNLRTEGADWWPTEVPNLEEEERFRNTLFERFGGKVDVIVTHTCPATIAYAAGFTILEPDPTMDILQDVFKDSRLEYGTWICGHWHLDRYLESYKTQFLLDDVVRIG